MSENVEFLVSQGLTEEEADELIKEMPEDRLDSIGGVSMIFASRSELARHYLDNIVGSLDGKVEDAIDMDRLGKNVAAGDEYHTFSSGRIAEFVM